MACLLGPQFTYYGTAYYEQVQFEDVLVTGVVGTVAEGGAGSGAEMRYVQCTLPEGVEAAEAAEAAAEAADGADDAEAADGADGTVGGVEADGAGGGAGAGGEAPREISGSRTSR